MKKLISTILVVAILFSFSVPVNAAEKKVSLTRCKVTFSKKSYTYTGTGILPTPKVTYKKKKLKKDKDFSIYFKDNVNVGTATVTLVGMGDYCDSTTATFVIKKGKQKITAKNIKATYGDDPIYIVVKSDNPLTYKSSNKSVARVSEAGIVTVKNAGKAKITIKAAGNNNVSPAKKTITVTVKKAKPKVTAFGGVIAKGDKWDVKAETTSCAQLSYSSSNPKVATVSKKGIVTAKKIGTVTITVKSKKTRNFKAGVKKVKVRVSDGL